MEQNETHNKSFDYAEYIDYDPEPDRGKPTATNSPMEAAPCEVPKQTKQEMLKDTILEHIKSTKCKDTGSFVTKERFVCSICFAIFLECDLLKQHFINDHSYEEGEKPIKIEPPSKPIEVEPIEIIQPPVEVPAEPATIEVAEEPVKKEKEPELGWLSVPISLKILKQKLYKIFTIKCSFNGCVYQFEVDEKRVLHEKCHVSSDADQIRQFKCLECPVETKMWRNCTAHMWKDHKIDIDLLKCPFCSFKAVLSVKIFRHMQVHKEMKGFVCSLCPDTFTQFTQLRVHVGTAHVENNQPDANSRWYSKKTCEICSNVFANSKTLTKHVKTVHNRIKPFICNVCGYKSARKSTWEIHTRQHTGEKPMACKVCSFCTADPSVLRKHEMRHNDKTKYKCTECEYSSIQSINFKSHIKRHHPEYYNQLLCDQCSFVSVNLDALRKHVQDHRLGLIRNEDSNDAGPGAAPKSSSSQPNTSVEISSDCFLPVESTDSLPHDPPLDTGGVTIPAHHSDEAQFPHF